MLMKAIQLMKGNQLMKANQARPTRFFSYFRRNYDLYLLLIPGLAYVLVFKLLPILGIYIAFLDYGIFAGDNPIDSIFKSEFVGLENFRAILSQADFQSAFGNTLAISFQKIVFLFPLPIALALLLNGVRSVAYKRVTQTILYLPHFLSWIVVSGMFLTVLGLTGPVNGWLQSLGLGKIRFFMDNNLFRGTLVFSAGWKEIGWSSIVYLAALTGVDPEQYEAATIDGASAFKKLFYITLPGIASTIVLMLILRIGGVMDAGFEQILIMYNPVVYKTADIIQTYVYRISMGQLKFSTGTAIGLFNSLIAFLLIVGANLFARKFLDKSIW
jgi:putative aldouronate transport system permease protein